MRPRWGGGLRAHQLQAPTQTPAPCQRLPMDPSVTAGLLTSSATYKHPPFRHGPTNSQTVRRESSSGAGAGAGVLDRTRVKGRGGGQQEAGPSTPPGTVGHTHMHTHT